MLRPMPMRLLPICLSSSLSTIQLRTLSINARIPESFLSSLIHVYGPMLGVQHSILSTVIAFQVVSGVLLLLTSRIGRTRAAWRWKYMIVSVSFIGYIGYSLG